MSIKMLPQKYFAKDALDTAQSLLGMVIEYNGCSGMIVETEAYKDDKASHAHNLTPRSEIMLRSHGHIYVYFVYGMYHCLNITTNKGARGAVLIRALEPLDGIEKMQKRRATKRQPALGGNIKNLCSGPGKLCQALGITKTLNDTVVNEKIKIYEYEKIAKKDIISSPRVGIKKATDLHWRFHIRDNPYVSKTS